MRKTVIPEWFKAALEVNGKQVGFPETAVEFMRRFNTQEDCLSYLVSLKYSGGFVCPHCGSKQYGFIKTRGSIQCKKCGRQESPTANTIFEYTHKPLPEWFYAIYLLATQKTGMSAMELYRQMKFGSYKTAWVWLHKIRTAMVRPDRDKLCCAVEVDEAYVGGKGEVRGRGASETQSVVVVAVEIKHAKDGSPASGRIRARVVPDASAPSLTGFIKDHIEKGCLVFTDDWTGYKPLKKYGYVHEAIKTGAPSEASAKFPRVHRVISNLKAWLNGTHRFASKKHLQNYLNEFVFRFNRRNIPHEAFRSLMRIAVQTTPPRFEELIAEKQKHLNGKTGESL